MGEKDIAEKTFIELNDVFADIFNGLIFEGKQVIKPEQLSMDRPFSQYKADNDALHEQERDVLKCWDGINFRLCMAGEIQTKPDRDAPFRIISYDGSSYRSQLLKKKPKNRQTDKKNDKSKTNLAASTERYPVVTLILYFGKRKWNYPKNLIDSFRPKLPDNEDTRLLKKYISDYKINVFDISRLKPDTVKLFHSDFRLVADYFINSRQNANYRPDEAVIHHVDEFLKLMAVLTGDNRYKEIGTEFSDAEKKEGIRMCKVLDAREARGEAKGIKKGLAQGRIQTLQILNNFVNSGTITAERAASELGITVKQYEDELAKIKSLVN